MTALCIWQCYISYEPAVSQYSYIVNHVMFASTIFFAIMAYSWDFMPLI